MFYNSLQLTTIECNTIHLGDYRIFSRIISFLQNLLGLSIPKLHLSLVANHIALVAHHIALVAQMTKPSENIVGK